jgi:prevent-host-death family protein
MAIFSDHNQMTKTVVEAKEQFCEIVSRASQGQATTVTRDNRPVAKIVPAQSESRRLTDEWRQRVANIRLNRKCLPKRTISELIQERHK